MSGVDFRDMLAEAAHEHTRHRRCHPDPKVVEAALEGADLTCTFQPEEKR